jgi:hypothetical protein
VHIKLKIFIILCERKVFLERVNPKLVFGMVALCDHERTIIPSMEIPINNQLMIKKNTRKFFGGLCTNLEKILARVSKASIGGHVANTKVSSVQGVGDIYTHNMTSIS